METSVAASNNTIITPERNTIPVRITSYHEGQQSSASCYNEHIPNTSRRNRSGTRNLIEIQIKNPSLYQSASLYQSPKCAQSNLLTFLLSNTRSLLPKVDELKIILDQYDVSMAFITETWLNEKIDDAAVCIGGYSIARCDRIDKLGGGVCAFIKSDIPFKILTEFNDINFETLWIS